MIQRLEADASLRPFVVRPNRRKVRIGGKVTAQRLRGVRRRDAPRHFAPPCRKDVFQAVDQKLLYRWEQGDDAPVPQMTPGAIRPADSVRHAPLKG